MQNTAANMEIEKPGKHLDDVARVCGRGKLIRDCFDMLIFASALDHSVDEAGTVRAKNPRDAHDQMPPDRAKPGSSFNRRQFGGRRTQIEEAGRPS